MRDGNQGWSLVSIGQHPLQSMNVDVTLAILRNDVDLNLLPLHCLMHTTC